MALMHESYALRPTIEALGKLMADEGSSRDEIESASEAQDEVPRRELAGVRASARSTRRHHALDLRWRDRCLEAGAARPSQRCRRRGTALHSKQLWAANAVADSLYASVRRASWREGALGTAWTCAAFSSEDGLARYNSMSGYGNPGTGSQEDLGV